MEYRITFNNGKIRIARPGSTYYQYLTSGNPQVFVPSMVIPSTETTVTKINRSGVMTLAMVPFYTVYELGGERLVPRGEARTAERKEYNRIRRVIRQGITLDREDGRWISKHCIVNVQPV